MTVRNANISFCSFQGSRGKKGSLKFYNKFDDDNVYTQKKKVHILEAENRNEKQNSFLISDCDFENEDESSTSIYFVGGKEGSDIEVKECTFKGKLGKGSHYIEGEQQADEKPKLKILSCKFEDDQKPPVNMEIIRNFDRQKIVLKQNQSNKLLVGALCVFLFTLAMAFLLIKIHSKENKNNEDNSYEPGELINIKVDEKQYNDIDI